MQHRERDMLTAGIGRLVSEVYALPSDPARAAALAAGLDPLLDGFLHERQPLRQGEVTVLIADIRGFTALTGALGPRRISELLNRFFALMSTIIARHGGVVDKFMGDAILALFGAPVARPDDLSRALACAVEMQRAMTQLNRDAAARGEPALYTGIALNTGEVTMGSFGSSVHSEYTVIGETVNLAARIESFSLRGQVLLSEAARAAAGALVETGRVNEVLVKGMPGPVVLHELLSVNGPRRLEIPRVEPRRSPRIEVDLAALFQRVEAKRILPGSFQGRVLDLGYEGMGADLPMGLPAFAEVLIKLAPTDALSLSVDAAISGERRPGDGEVYARVLRSHAVGDSFRTSLEFTSMETPGHQRLKHLVDDALWRR